jgi:hypothetical protein
VHAFPALRDRVVVRGIDARREDGRRHEQRLLSVVKKAGNGKLV